MVVGGGIYRRKFVGVLAVIPPLVVKTELKRKNMTNRKQGRFLSLALLAATLTLPAMAQRDEGTLIEFDAPGAARVSSPACGSSCGTTPYANNDLGDIVGSYTDVNVVAHGFLRHANGKIISFDAPGAGLGAGRDQGTLAMSINNLGVIAGQLQDSNNVFHGFLRDPYGFFTTFDVPAAGTGAYQGT